MVDFRATPVNTFQLPQKWFLRDVRPLSVKAGEFFGDMQMAGGLLLALGFSVMFVPEFSAFADFIGIFAILYFRWANKRPFKCPIKIPAYAAGKVMDPNNPPPGRGGAGKPEGILYLGTDEDNGREIWVTNNDARTHFLYLGTTGSGKTEGLKSLVTNALSWGSGYVYVDGKADTDLWASLYAMSRRFGRDDDVLILNYMTGNSDEAATSNTMNPFATGSSSYLVNLVTNLMPEAGGDNAMWKERAVALMFALMPALTWKRDHQGLLFDIGVLRDHLELQPIIRLSRDPNMPERIIRSLQGYLSTLPGYVDAAFDDEGNERPPSPDQPMYDLQVARQQHGYLSMQFTRALQSLADDYGYIFKVQFADIDMIDVVLNRRILIALIPALEKSGDEAANLGKIIASTLKGMMGSTLGAQVEGGWEEAIGTKQTRSQSSFITVFDEVGYYTSQGMAVMAAQARSLGFSLVFASQDLPSMEKRIKGEARSITANCNVKIFGKIEDPLDTQEFLNKHRGDEWVMETRGMTFGHNTLAGLFSDSAYYDDRGASLQVRPRVSYDHLRKQREGQAYIFLNEILVKARMFYAVPEKAKALRVQKLLPVPGTTTATGARDKAIQELTANLVDQKWAALGAMPAAETPQEVMAILHGYETARKAGLSAVECGAAAIAALAEIMPAKTAETMSAGTATAGGGQQLAAPQQKTGVVHTTFKEKPPLRTGDEAAFEDIDVSKGSFINNKPSAMPAHTAAAMAGKSGDGSGERGEDMSSDRAGISTRAISGIGDDLGPVARKANTDVKAADFELPQEIAAIVKESADKFKASLVGGSDEKTGV